MVRFSLVIPQFSNASHTANHSFDDTLAAALRYRCDSCQIIVVHDGDYDDPYDLGQEVDFVTSSGNANNLIEQFNVGVRSARGTFVGLLRPGVQLDEGWEDAIASAFEDPSTGSVAPAVVSSNTKSKLVTAGVSSNRNFTRLLVAAEKTFSGRSAKRIRPLGPCSWAGFYRRNLLNALGDIDPSLDSLYLDLELALSLQSFGFGCQFSPDCLVTLDDSTMIETEARQPHGQSAQRAFVRHGELATAPSLIQTLATMTGELLASPWKPQNLRHAFQRLATSRFATDDLHHRELIGVLKKQRDHLIVEPISQPVAPQIFEQPLRRAA